MKYSKESEPDDTKLDESALSQFRKYLGEISKLQRLAVTECATWWDK